MDLAEYFASRAIQLGALADDINGIIHTKKTGEKHSRRSLERMTKLRANTQELKDAEKRDKDEQFILDQIDQIFKG